MVTFSTESWIPAWPLVDAPNGFPLEGVLYAGSIFYLGVTWSLESGVYNGGGGDWLLTRALHRHWHCFLGAPCPV